MSEQDGGPKAGRGAFHRLAAAIVWLRFLIVAGWIAAAVLVTLRLPSIFAAESGSLGNLLPSSSEAIVAERKALQQFGLPVTTPVLAVATQPGRLAPQQLQDAAAYIARVNKRPFKRNELRVLPLLDLPALAGPSGTNTIVTYLYLAGDLSESQREATAQRFAVGLRRSTGVETTALTGPVPAGWAQSRIGNDHLVWLELATVAIVIAVLILFFRAPGVPLVGIATVAIAYLLTSHVLGWVGERFGLSIPSEVDPVVIALLFGTLTDYVVFFVSAWRRLLLQGRSSREAVTQVTAELLPVILTAALMIAGAILTLLLSDVKFLTTFVPGMTIAVLIGASVAVTIVPAFLAVAGPALLWPRRPERSSEGPAAAPRAQAHLVGAAVAHPLVVSVLCVVLLGAAATGITRISLGDPVIRGLPSWSEPRQGYEATSQALGPGVVAPTVLVVRANGITARRRQLADLQLGLARQPGTGAVLGPGDDLLARRRGVVLAPDGDAARFVLVLDADPSSSRATAILASLRARLPALLARAGLGSAQAAISGETAITAELGERTERALVRVAPAALLVLLLLLWVLLRSRRAPFYLVAAGALVVVAALGLTAYFFQGLLGYGELVFFVPVAAAILLLALGSDYNVFLVSRIWQLAESRTLPRATRVAGSRAARAITVAGLVLALSFSAVALVPILAFRELAFAMCVGLLLDTLVARTFLIPALINLFGGGGARTKSKPDA